jgi:uncharacterized protein (TIGR02266 family)
MAEGNRKDPRARVLNMTVRYKSATVDEFIENHSHDISRGGIFIKTRAPFPAGTLLKFEVRIAEDQRLMQGVGRVVWRREPERAEEGFPAGMGIKFIKTGEGAAELISQIVASREGEESSFDAGARENGAVSDAPRSEGRHSVPAAPDAAEATSTEAPSLKVESAPAEGEIYVSSPPKKRVPVTSETRKVVLQGTEAPPSDKTPISTRARDVSAQASGSERAPSRPAPATRGSIVDETTAPRARSADAQSPRAAKEQSSSPSVLGLVAILGAVAITLLVVKLLRGPEAAPPAPPPPAVTSTTPPAPPAAVPPAEPEPSAAAPTPGATDTPPATEPAPAAAAPSEPTAAGGAAATATPKPSSAPTPAATGSTAKPPAVPPSAVAPSAKPVPPVAPAPAAAKPAPAPKPPAAAAPSAAPPAGTAPKPKAEAKPAAPAGGEPGASVQPAAPVQEPAVAGSAGATNDAKAHPAEPAKKHPPAATAPSQEAAPKPAEPSPAKPGPSDDNPY